MLAFITLLQAINLGSAVSGREEYLLMVMA